jgi:hypothetical protein
MTNPAPLQESKGFALATGIGALCDWRVIRVDYSTPSIKIYLRRANVRQGLPSSVIGQAENAMANRSNHSKIRGWS